MIVQWYKSQMAVGSYLWPVPPGGASLNWPLNYSVPPMAGNFWRINYIQGFQQPSVDATIVLVDGSVNTCPLVTSTLQNLWMTRTSDYQHDTSAIAGGISFFDAYSGFAFTSAKMNSFSLSGSKGDDVRFSMNAGLFGTIPSVTTTAPAAYNSFTGNPVRFQSLSFTHNSSPLNGLLSFSISFTNNNTPDMSMVGTGPQSPFPVDVNAGEQTCSATFTFQANSTQHIATGDTITVQVSQGSIGATFTLSSLVVDTPNNRSIGSGRQTRTYSCTVVGENDSTPPLTIS
jgi:hypothetical protein